MLSEVPEGWEETTFGKQIDFKGGNQPPKSTFVYQPTDGYVRLLQIRDFENDDKPAFIPVDATKVRCTKDDILIARYGASLGRICRGKEGAYNVALVKLILSNKLCNDFTYYWLNSEHFQNFLARVGSRSAQAGFNKDDLAPLPLLIPSLNEQHRIAEILSSVDASIQATQAVIEQAERVKRGLMEELLTGGLGSEAIERGEVPEGWEIITLASDGIDLIDGDRGKQYPKSSDFSGEGYCLFLSAKNVTKQGFRFDEKQFVTKEKHEALRKGALERDDIVVTTRGTVGNVAHFNSAVPYDIVRINSGMVIVRNQSERVLTDYLFNYLASSVVDEQIKLRTHGSAQPALTIKTLKTLRVALPSLSRQQHINSILLSENAAIAASFKQLHSLQRLKIALMDDLLTGKVRTI